MFRGTRPVLGGLCLTSSQADLELYVPLACQPDECRYAYLPIASVSAQSSSRDISAFFETIKFLTCSIRDTGPLSKLPLHPAALATEGTIIDGLQKLDGSSWNNIMLFRARVFLFSGFVHKVFGPIPLVENNALSVTPSSGDFCDIPLAGWESDIDSRMKAMVDVMNELGSIRNISFSVVSPFALLKYERVPGLGLCFCNQIYGSAFRQVLDALQKIHARSFSRMFDEHHRVA
eukprot:c18641_g2_i1.p1 GENE.c18641_g2_i1~~c18641_g2_i1.p1  ORF type:complete len:233 (-),score=40.55 c18641_g2_i1:285-983(-)